MDDIDSVSASLLIIASLGSFSAPDKYALYGNLLGANLAQKRVLLPLIVLVSELNNGQ